MEFPFEKNRESHILPTLTFEEKHIDQLIAENVTVNCLKCDEKYEFPKLKDDYLAHLFLKHRMVIADVDDIADLVEYLVDWRKQFEKHELEEFCTTMLLDQLPDGTAAKNEKYYLLSDILPQDYELRKKLQHQRLEKALTRHQFERTDREFSKECLYCRDIIKGLRAEFLEHLFTKHFLQLGKPENLVYVDELIAKVQHNLEQLVCLYCEKIFKDRVTLKDHMRKKGHKRINPNNRSYDKYFLVNYRNQKPKPAKSINKRIAENAQRSRVDKRDKRVAVEEQKKLEEKQEQQVIEQKQSTERSITESSVDFDKHFAKSDDSDSDWSDWDGEQPPLNCLYCTQKKPEFSLLKTHMLVEHKVDFDRSVKDLNFYQKIKVVNYVRRQVCTLRCVTCNKRCESPEALLQHLSAEEHFSIGTKNQWDRPEYFFPTYEDDGLLCVLDDCPNDDVDDTVVRIISEDSVAKINKDAERLSLENFQFL